MRFALIYIIVLTFIYSRSSAQASEINGVVSIQNSKENTRTREYVQLALVKDYSGKSNSRFTNVLGEFKLKFVGVADNITVYISVEKSGLEVVNIDALSVVAGQKDTIKICMATPEKIAEYRTTLYNIGKTNAEKRLENLIKDKNERITALEKNNRHDTITIAALKDSVSVLITRLKKVDEEAKRLSEKYSLINLDDEDSVFRKAFSFFQAGKLDSALKILEKDDADNTIRYFENEQSKLDKDKRNFAKRLLLHADIHKTQYEFDSVSRCYEQLLRLDSTNLDYNFLYAGFLSWIGNYDKAFYYYQKVLDNSYSFKDRKLDSNALYIGRAQNQIGNVYFEKKNYDSAKTAYFIALNARKQLAKNDSTKYYSGALAETLNNIGLLYFAVKRFDSSDIYFSEALSIRKTLARSDSVLYEPEMAKTLNNLGNLYTEANKLVQAEISFKQALFIRKKYIALYHGSQEPEIAAIQNNLGTLYYKKNEPVLADSAFNEALKIYQDLVKTNPDTYNPLLAKIQNNLGNIYNKKNEYNKALIAYNESLSIRTQLAKNNPEIYLIDLVNTYYNVARLFRKFKQYQQAEDTYGFLIEMWKPFVSKNFPMYGSEYANAKNGLGDVYFDKAEYSKAYTEYSNASATYDSLQKNDPLAYNILSLQTKNNLALVLMNQKKYAEFEQALDQSLKLLDTLFKDTTEANIQASVLIAIRMQSYYAQVISDNAVNDHDKNYYSNKQEYLQQKINNVITKNSMIAQAAFSYYSDWANSLLYNLKFKEAENVCKNLQKAITLKPDLQIILATSLLFQDNYNDALKMYDSILNADISDKKNRLLCITYINNLLKKGAQSQYADKMLEHLNN